MGNPVAFRRCPASFVLGFAFLASTAFSAPAPDVTGNWAGTLQIEKAKLRVQFKIGKTPEGTLGATMDSLDQGLRDMPVEKVTLKDDKVVLDVKFIEGRFEGAVDPAGNNIAGNWVQAGQKVPLTLVRGKPGADPTLEDLSPVELAASKKAAEKLKGEWNGTLASPDAKYQLVLKISTNSVGAATGTMDSPDFGLRQIPVTGISYKDGSVRFEARGLTAFYEGSSFNNSTTLTGQWHQAGQVLPLSFRKASPPAAK
jgi:hypothetical protein